MEPDNVNVKQARLTLLYYFSYCYLSLKLIKHVYINNCSKILCTDN